MQFGSIEKTIMLASLWGLIICNGVFVFLGCVERIVKKDSASQFFNKNKIFSWTNLILLFIFANALWSSIVDAYNWGGSIITFCQNLRQFIAPLGFVTILIVFAIAAFCSTKKNKILICRSFGRDYYDSQCILQKNNTGDMK